jgi:hypothetical protein
MAAPIVSSVVAQMLEANSALTPGEIEKILCDTAQPLENFPRERQGHGVLNAAHAVAFALRAREGVLQGLALSPQVNDDAVTFRYFDLDARRVAVVGDWNGFKPHTHRLHEVYAGVWEITMPRPPRGEYAYKFLVERETRTLWLGDPENLDRVEDGAGGFFSLLKIGK